MRRAGITHFAQLTQWNRFTAGMTIVELLVAVVIVGIAVAGLSETVMLTGKWWHSLNNKLDNVHAAKKLINMIEKDVRMSYMVSSLSSTSLTLEIPIFDSNGFPIRNGTRLNCDQVAYTAVIDPDASKAALGEYVILRSYTPGVYTPPKSPITNQTVLTGLIGPLSTTGTGAPVLFSSLNSTGPGSNIRAVIVNMETRKNSSSFAGDSATHGYKTEVFLRNKLIF